ncbi:translation initiation factor IF-2 infB, partial [Mycobacterium tuberculosis SUMu002]
MNRSVAANLPRRKAPPSPPAKAPTSPLTRRWTPRSTWPQATARRLPRPPRPPIPAGRQSSPQLPPPHPSLRPQCRPALRHPPRHGSRGAAGPGAEAGDSHPARRQQPVLVGATRRPAYPASAGSPPRYRPARGSTSGRLARQHAATPR